MARPKLTRAERKRANQVIRSTLEGIAGEVAAIPSSALIELAPVLQQAERETAAALREWLASAGDAAERYTAHQHRQLLLQLRTARYGSQRVVLGQPSWVPQVAQGMKGALSHSAKSSSSLATSHVMEEIRVFSGVFRQSQGGIQLAEAALLKRGAKTLVPRFAKSAERYAGAMWTDMRRQLAIGMVRKQTIGQMTSRLQKLGGPRTASAPEGLFRRYRHWAERVVRTETINAYNVLHSEAIKELAEDDPGYKKRWDASLDSRLCKICNELHGEVRALDELFTGGYEHPPAHPNCRCALVTWHDDWGNPQIPKRPDRP